MHFTGTIYALAEPGTGEIRYCGKTVKPLSYRMSAHKGDAGRQSRRHLYRWLRLVYQSGHEPDVLVCENVDLSGLSRATQLARLNEAEAQWIAQLKALGFQLTNATSGGDGCHGRIVSAETRAKTAASNRGKKRSAECRLRNREIALARSPDSFLRGSRHHQFGKAQKWEDPAARAKKIRDAWLDNSKRIEHGRKSKAVWSNPEMRIAQSERHRGTKNTNAKINEAAAAAIYAASGSYAAVASAHGTTKDIVRSIKVGRTWNHVTGHSKG